MIEILMRISSPETTLYPDDCRLCEACNLAACLYLPYKGEELCDCAGMICRCWTTAYMGSLMIGTFSRNQDLIEPAPMRGKPPVSLKVLHLAKPESGIV